MVLRPPFLLFETSPEVSTKSEELPFISITTNMFEQVLLLDRRDSKIREKGQLFLQIDKGKNL